MFTSAVFGSKTSQPLKRLLGPAHHLQLQSMSGTAQVLYPADGWDWGLQPAKPRVFDYLCPDLVHHQTTESSAWCVCFSHPRVESHVKSPKHISQVLTPTSCCVLLLSHDNWCYDSLTTIKHPKVGALISLTYFAGASQIIYTCNHYILFKGKRHTKTETCALQTSLVFTWKFDQGHDKISNKSNTKQCPLSNIMSQWPRCWINENILSCISASQMNSPNKTSLKERKFPALRNLKNDIYIYIYIATNQTNTKHWSAFPQYFENQYTQDSHLT